MKKLFVLLLALSVVGIAFAQDAAPAPVLKLSGYLNYGGAYSSTKAEALGATATSYVVTQNGNDSSTNGRFQLNGSYTNGDYGVAFRLRAQGDFTKNPDVFTRRVYGWTNLFGGKVKFQAGRLGDYTWAGANGNFWNCFGSIDGPTGVQLQIMPIDGLNMGVFVPLTVSDTTSDVNKLKNVLGSSEIALNYQMKDTFDFQAGVLLAPDTPAVAAAAAIPGHNSSYDPLTGIFTPGASDTPAVAAADAIKNTGFFFGGDVLMVPNLTLGFEGLLSNLGDSKAGSSFVYEDVEYAMAPLTLKIQMSQEFFHNSDVKSQMEFAPEVDYAVSASTTVGVSGDVALKDGKTGYDFGPFAKFVTNKDSFIKLGVGYASGDWYATSANVVFYAPGAWNNKVAKVQGVDVTTKGITSAYLDFVWNF